MKRYSFLFTIILTLLVFNSANSCTNFLITKGASTDGSTMITYAADSHQLYGALYFWPSMDWATGTKLDIYEWDTGKYLGQIPQVPHTYQVVGNINEHQLAIGETTYGGLPQLGKQEGAIMDYGSLIYVALQRAKTAREAIKIISELMDEYGYASSGESFSIADPDEVWIMELIGKGDGHKGAVWVARLVPDGYVCGHANQSRITTFPIQKANNWDDKKQTTYHAMDVVSFAKEAKLYEGKDKDFSFSDVYAPVGFGGARFCEIRVFAFFKDVNKEIKDNANYWEYVKGNVTHATAHAEKTPMTKENYANNRMPLWIKPDAKISVHDVMNYMRDHLEGTELDMTKDIGAGAFGCPYRWRGLTWEYNDVRYCNERATATQQTGFSFVTQSRNTLPDPIGGIIWFSVDDAASTVYAPMYCGMNKIPETFSLQNGSMIEWSDNSAFWIFNQVSNLAYTRYDTIHGEIHIKQQNIEKKYIDNTSAIDNAAKTLYEQDKNLGIQFITDYSCNTANTLVAEWKIFYQYLFMKYMDGNIKQAKDEKLLENGAGNGIPLYPAQPGYGKAWYKRIVDETGDQFKMKGDGH